MPINPDILKQSREYIALSIPEASVILSKEEKLLKQWEAGDKEPTYLQLCDISKRYCQPINSFYLSSFPHHNFDSDFRLRDANNIKSDYNLKKEYLLTKGWVNNFEVLDNTSLPQINDLIKHLRQHIAYKDQRKEKKDLFRFLRKKIENIFDILIFQTDHHNKIDKNIHGVCLSINNLHNKAIIINKDQSDKSKAFTLLHELYHLLKKQPSNTFTLSYNNEERECNEFSSEILLPNNIFLEETISINNWEQENIKTFSKNFNVSKSLFITKLVKNKKITNDFYEKLKAEYDKEYKESHFEKNKPQQKKKGGGGTNTYLHSKINRLGRTYIRSVYNAYSEQSITMYDALKYLNLKAKHFDKLVDLV